MLQFQLDHAEKIAQLEHLQKIAAKGQDIPFIHTWNNRPKPLLTSQWVWQAWEVLSSRRFYFDGSPQAIQLTELFKYADEVGITSAPMREDLMAIVVTLDIMWREHMLKRRHERMLAERRKQEAEAKKGGKGGRR